MHSITRRRATETEQQFIRAGATQLLGAYFSVAVLALLAGVATWFAGRWIGGLFSPAAAISGRILGAGVAVVGYVMFIVKFRPYERRWRERAQRDIEAAEVQEISVRGARVVEIGLIDDNEPILAFDIGKGLILFLRGQWLRESHIYGAEAVDEDELEEEFINGLRTPHSFPSDAFTLMRLPHTGRVLSIRVEGEYLAPGPAVEALKPEYEFGESELFRGNLESIAAVLETEHSRRSMEPRRA